MLQHFLSGIMDPLIKAVAALLGLAATWAAWKAKQYLGSQARVAARVELTDAATDAAAFVERHIVRPLKDPQTPETWDLEAQKHARETAKRLAGQSGQHALTILQPSNRDELLNQKVERAVLEIRRKSDPPAAPAAGPERPTARPPSGGVRLPPRPPSGG